MSKPKPDRPRTPPEVHVARLEAAVALLDHSLPMMGEVCQTEIGVQLYDGLATTDSQVQAALTNAIIAAGRFLIREFDQA